MLFNSVTSGKIEECYLSGLVKDTAKTNYAILSEKKFTKIAQN